MEMIEIIDFFEKPIKLFLETIDGFFQHQGAYA